MRKNRRRRKAKTIYDSINAVQQSTNRISKKKKNPEKRKKGWRRRTFQNQNERKKWRNTILFYFFPILLLLLFFFLETVFSVCGSLFSMFVSFWDFLFSVASWSYIVPFTPHLFHILRVGNTLMNVLWITMYSTYLWPSLLN